MDRRPAVASAKARAVVRECRDLRAKGVTRIRAECGFFRVVFGTFRGVARSSCANVMTFAYGCPSLKRHQMTRATDALILRSRGRKSAGKCSIRRRRVRESEREPARVPRQSRREM